MSQTKKIVRNTGWAFAGRIIDMLSNLLLISMTARYLGVKDFGTYSLVMAVYWIVFPLMLQGNRIIIREANRDNSRMESLIGNMLTIVGSVSVLSLMAIFIYVLVSNPQPKVTLALLLALGVMFTMGVLRTINAIFVAMEAVRFDTYISIFLSISNIAFLAMAIHLDLGFVSPFAGMCLAQIVGTIASLFMANTYFSTRPRPVFDAGMMKLLVTESWPLVVSVCFFQLYLNSGVFALAFLSGEIDAGIYQAPLRLIIRLQIIPLAISMAMAPMLSRMAVASAGKEAMGPLVGGVVKGFFSAGFLVSIILFALSGEVVSVMLGEAFSQSASAMRLQAFALAPFFVTVFLEAVLVSMGRQKTYAAILGMGAAVNVALNVLFIKSGGVMGASLAFVLSMTFIMLVACRALRDIVYLREMAGVFLKPVSAAFLAVAALFALWFLWANPFVSALAGMAVFGAALYLGGAFTETEIARMKEIIGVRKRPETQAAAEGDNTVRLCENEMEV